MKTFVLNILISGFISIGCSTANDNKVPASSVSIKPDSTQKVSGVDTIKYNRYWNDYARLVAGLEPLQGSKLDSLDYTPEALQHRKLMAQVWASKENQYINKLKTWSSEELPNEFKKTPTVFYPFSGADFMTVHSLFPNADKYVFYGLESEGSLKDVRTLTRPRLDANLKNIHYSIKDIVNESFFYTLAMSRDLHKLELNGTLPVLLLFMAGTGNEVLDVKAIKLNRQGQVVLNHPQVKQSAYDTTISGIEIKFRAAKGLPTQTLQYFSLNIEDAFIKQNGLDAQLKYFDSFSPSVTFIKSASYLLHNAHFSFIRNKLLAVSGLILQDDTGIPIRYFDDKTWDLTYYGNYTGPIQIFKNYYQYDLAQKFQTKKPKPLDFGMGYKYVKGTNSLILGRKKVTAGVSSIKQP